MKNLIISWKGLAQEQYGSIAEGVRHLNIVCGTKITPTCINEMSKGKKSVPASINRQMLQEVFFSELKKEGFKIKDISSLLENISIPGRVR